jgi:5-bromo-4-chloroindolyl phosphate hydrolysis protein
MSKIEKLANVAGRKGMKTWEQVKGYIENFSKYDSFTYRDIDNVVRLINSGK